MDIEIKDFYPLVKNDFQQFMRGNLRISIPDLKLDILGIEVQKKKDKWYFWLPMKIGTEHDTGKKVWYPCITFYNREFQKSIIKEVKKLAPEYIEKRLSDKANPLKFPEPHSRAPQPYDRKEKKVEKNIPKINPRPFNPASHYVNPPKRSVYKSSKGRS